MKTVLSSILTLTALVAVEARGATYTVTSLADSGPGTLRTCIQLANGNAGADTVTFHSSLNGTIRPLSTIFVTESVLIMGPASRGINISGDAAGIIFYVNAGADVELGLIDLEMHDGTSAVFFPMNAKLNVHRCVFRNFGVDGAIEAGVFNSNWASAKSLVGSVYASSFINNRGVHAGVITTVAKPSGESLEFVNCTFCNNSSSHGAAVAWIWNGGVTEQGVTNFINCTLTDNNGGDAGHASGVIENTGTVLACRVKNCVWDGNTAGSGDSPNFTGAGAVTGTVLEGVHIFSGAMLSPLQLVDHQYVRIPLPGSPCIDAAFPDTAALSDQLGKSRPFMVPGATPAPGSDGSDVGAVERQSGGCGLADINGNGRVDGADLSVMLSTFGSTCP